MKSFPQFIETVRFTDGEPQLLDFHHERVKQVFDEYAVRCTWSLSDILKQMPSPIKCGTVKCRVLYDEEVRDIRYTRYQKREINSLKAVPMPVSLDYHLKYADRKVLQDCYEQKGVADDILLFRENGEITDTSYSNILLRKEHQLYTPARPLLKGVQRSWLLEQGMISEKVIYLSELSDYDSVLLINAMMPIDYCIEVPVTHILL